MHSWNYSKTGFTSYLWIYNKKSVNIDKKKNFIKKKHHEKFEIFLSQSLR